MSGRLFYGSRVILAGAGEDQAVVLFYNNFRGVKVLQNRILSFALVVAGYGLLLAAVYYPVVFQAMVPAAPDSIVPAALDNALQHLQHTSGRYPLWQPWVFSGMPTVEAFSFLSGLYFPQCRDRVPSS